MKIKKIKIKDYKQFKDTEIDLTYPKGHEKEGKPLDKICIIGQSGTGKTTLLRLIKWYVARDRRINENFSLPLPDSGSVSIDFEFFDLYYTLINMKTELEHHSFGMKDRNGRKASFDHWHNIFTGYLKKTSPFLINYPADLITGAGPIEKEKRPSIDEMEKKSEQDDYLDKLKPKPIVDFAFEDIRETWDFVLKDIKEHREKELLIKDKIVETESNQELPLQEVEKKFNEYKKWLAQNPNPLKTMAARFLDSILLKVGLKVKTGLSLKSIRDLSFIELQSLTGEDVPRDLWSTGTRQLVLTLIPIYQLKPQSAVILVDEPERSLYPDIQLSIIDYYIDLAPTCQFFFSTHSPIIASSFEPWEIIELKFDDEHKYVYRDLNYEGENHVDNYKYDPRYLRWDSNIMRIFELGKEGGKKRHEALKKLAELNVRIEKLKTENKLESPGGKGLVDEYLKICKILDWRIEDK